MPGYREQYPPEDDEQRARDDWIEGYLSAEYERFLYEQEQLADHLTSLDYMILDMMIMEDDWD